MTETILQKLTQFIFRPKFYKLENKIGYKICFQNIPKRFINGLVEWDITDTFKKFGINVEEGTDYWTIGRIIGGTSSRFNRNVPEYQSWLGGYIVKLPTKQSWIMKDHFKLAIADQNSWLHTYGDPNPVTSIEGYEFKEISPINAGQYSGILYEFGCTTHSDVGNGKKPLKFKVETDIMANLFNLSNPELKMKGEMLRLKVSDSSYETLELRGYIAIFDVEEKVKVVLYGNGALVDGMDTFEIIKDDLLKAMKSCKIVRI
jgi:hypothetical protein